ncbi:70 kDa peptidyl-prolyl isomerase-like protein [Trifolium pratense]|uniref:peptidylprolyl isomerase n=1 Tax=Trifolium pratense TaxID=57577 RepID=A0A2K3KBW1_TRIPR|nr:70 kDa peptidyl-prolyl isomerase-like protein [Trifolium pratense]
MAVLSEIEEDELDEEPGEVIESAPPQKLGEERQLNSNSPIKKKLLKRGHAWETPNSNSPIKKKLLKRGHGWETPNFNDQVTVHYVGTLLDGTKLGSTRDSDCPVTFTLGQATLTLVIHFR